MQHILNNEHENEDLNFLLIHFYINYMSKLYFEYIVKENTLKLISHVSFYFLM